MRGIHFIWSLLLLGLFPVAMDAQYVVVCNQPGAHYYAVDTLENNGAGTLNAMYAWTVNAPGAIVNENQGPNGSSNGITIDWSSVTPGYYEVSVFETDLISGCAGDPMNLQIQVVGSVNQTIDIIVCDAQLPYNWNGNAYNAAGSYSVTLQNASGCDSIVTLNLSLNPSVTASVNATICDAQLPYNWNGNAYNAAGSYSLTLQNVAGCDSIVTLNLTVNPSVTASVNATICDAQLPYTWNGNAYNAAGSYSVTLQNTAGCDSIVTLNLTVNPSVTASVNATICDAQLPYNWNGNAYNAAGSYSVTLQNVAGCDSIVTLNLSVNPSVTASVNATICDAQLPYTWNGNAYNAAGSYSVALQNAAGCDSVVTLNLSVNPSVTASVNATICYAQLPYTWNGNAYNAAGSYSMTLQNAAGCDSIVTLNLSVNPSVTASVNATICDAQLPYTWNGNAYNAAGSYSVTLQNAAGCDSIVTLNLSVNPSITASVNATICDAQLPYNWNSNAYNAAGSYSVTLQNAAGCDSIVTLNLSVNPSVTASVNATICDAQLPYTWNGNAYNAAGSYSVTLQNTAGCDSIVTLNLSVNPSVTVSVNATICDAQLPYTWNGNAYNAAGSYSVTLQNTAGCDSIVTLNLTVNPSVTASVNATICDAQLPYNWNANSYNAAGSYSVTLQNAAGCDSIVTLNLSVNPSLTASQSVVICDAQLPYNWNGNAYNAAGSYSVTLQSAAGCDSIVTLNLSVNPSVTATVNATICDAQLPYNWNGNAYNAAGSYSVALQNAAGCDSVVTLNLSVNPSVTVSVNATICDAQLPYTWNGNAYNAAGSYSVTLQNAAGCDSIVTLNLSVNPSITASVNATICDAQLPYNWNGNAYNAAGSYSVTLQNAAGCDSIVTLNLTVNPSVTASVNATICDAQLPYNWNGNAYNAVGSYSVTLQNAAGCDSIVTLNLSVNPTLTATQSVVICDAQLPYNWNGNAYNAAGSYSVALQNAAGCDSVVTLNLSVNPSVTASVNTTICDAQLPYNWNGNAYNAAGSYSVTLQNAAGCDSIVTLNLNVNPTLTATQSVVICDAQLPYNWNGNAYNAAGSYSVTLQNAVGCDSIVTLNLSVNPTLTVSQSVVICDAQLPYNWNGNSYNAAGSYSVTLQNASGCDSIVTLNLSVNPSITASVNATICDAQLPYNWNGNAYSAAGSYSVTLQNAAGCDSIVTLNLSVNPSVTASVNATICDAQLPYTWNGNAYNAAGSYSVTLQNTAGCDSIVTLNLSVNPSVTASVNATICDAQLPYTWNGNAYNAAGSYSVTLQNTAGCDSIVTLNLSVNPSVATSVNATICDAQLPYNWNGNAYNAAGSYSVTLQNAAGCDSIVTLNLSVNPSVTASVNATICDAQLPYTWNGNAYNAAGSYSVTLQNAAGCDSIVTLNLSVNPTLAATQSVVICDAQLPYNWNGNSYYAAGSYSVTLQNAAGCDSIVTLNLSVNPSVTASVNATICDAQLPYTWNGNAYNAAGSYSVTLQNAAGCDSIVTLNLSVNPSVTASVNATICDAQLPYNWNGNAYNAAGSYSVTLQNAAGCDSIVTLNLSVNPTLAATQSVAICDAQLPYNWNGSAYNAAGSYSVTLQNAAGCDSIVTLNLSVNPSVTASVNATICDAQLPYTWNGNAYNAAGSYSVTLQNAAGCDSIVTLNLSVNPTLAATQSVVICDAQLPYTWNGNAYSAAGSYSVTLQNATGCDSIVTLNLTVNPSVTASMNATICDAQLPYNWNGNSYNAAGSYSVTLQNATGCDSIVTLNLSVNPSVTASMNATICDAQLPYNWNGNSYNAAGSYSVTLQNATGCDSIVTLNLSVNPSVTASVNATICDAQLPYNWHGNAYNAAGSYSVTLQNTAGCDSIVTLNLSVNPSVATSVNATICDAQLPYTWNGNAYNAAGSYSVTLQNAAGCDSIVTLNLSVNPTLASTQSVVICNAQLPYTWNGNAYNAAGSYSVTLQNAAGCDSIVTLNLSVNPTLAATQSVVICDAQLPYTWNGNAYNAAGSYSVTLQNASGCDSIVTLNLTVNPSVTVSVNATICDVQLPYTWNGNAYNASGSYNVTLQNAAGCDSIVTLNLSVNPTLAASQSVVICDAQLPYAWNGNAYNAAGSYSVTLQNAAGCDSIVTLNLQVLPSTLSSQTITILEGETYTLPDGVLVTATGSYTSIIANTLGCDSTITTNLIVLNGSTVTQEIDLCEGDLFVLPDGITVSTNGVYTSTLQADNGADSIIVTIITVHPIYTLDIPISICQGDVYTLPNGVNVTNSGDFTVINTSTWGCDSISVYHINVIAPSATDLNIALCDGESYTLPTGLVVNTAGNYIVQLNNNAGCDSVITFHIIVLPEFNHTISAVICANESYLLPDGSAVNSSGTFTTVLQGSNGCDSTVVTTLSVLPEPQHQLDVTICAGQSYLLPDGTIVNVSGDYQTVLASAAGCDSTVITHLQVVNVIQSQVDVVVCANESYTLPNGNAVTAAGDYSFTYTSSGGCDSIYTVHLSIAQPTQSAQSVVICNGDSFTLPDGVVVQSAGTFTSVLSNAAGCDSTIYTAVTLVQPTYQFVQASICQGDSYVLPNGIVVALAGSYPVTLTSAVGCDSVITTTLQVINTISTIQSAVICQGESFTLPDGVVVNTAGQYTSVLIAFTGCDSVVTTNLSVLPVFTQVITASICAGENYVLPDATSTSTAGTYTFILTSQSGCDSTLIVNLEVLPTIQVQQNVVICAGDSYMLPNGVAVTAAGSYPITETSSLGCDSVVTITVQLVNGYAVNQTVHICSNELYTLPDGILVNTSGVYTSTLLSAAGCDSIVTTNLIVHPIASPTIVAHICADENYTLPNGTLVNTTGAYPVMLQTLTGCDSIVTVQLTVHPVPAVVQVVHEICPNETVTLQNGQVVSASGMYPVTISTAWGCDSTIQNMVLVYPQYDQTIDVTLCANESYTLPDGLVVSQPGNYTSVLQTTHGCDSIIHVVIDLLPVYSQSINANICYNEVYALPDGTVAGATGAYSFTYAASSGCDSTVTYFIQVNDQIQTNINDYVCSGESYTLPNGTLVTQTGTYPTILSAAAGCDSLIVVNLVALNPIQAFDQTTICEGTTFTLPDGIQVGLGGTYESVLTSIQTGCDSLVFTTVTVDPAIEVAISPFQDTIQICAGDTTNLLGAGTQNLVWAADPGTLSTPNQTTTNAFPANSEMVYLIGTAGACQAVDSVFIEVMPLPDLDIMTASNELCLGDSMMLEATGGDSYTWSLDESLPCLTCATNWVSPTDTTTYTVFATLGMCSAEKTFVLNVSPNPVAGILADTVICAGDQIYLVASGGDHYLWSNGDTTRLSLIQPNMDMTYDLIASLGICKDTVSIEIHVMPIPDVYAGADTLISLGESVELLGVADGEPLWTPFETLSCQSCETPLATPTQTTEYCLGVVNEFGCINSDCVRVDVEIDCESFFIPNAFAPEAGGDVNNDCFKAFGMECFAEMKLTVFDRWGQIVFVTENPDDCWDGRLNEKPLNTGVYVYRFEGVLINGFKFEKNGNVTLIR